MNGQLASGVQITYDLTLFFHGKLDNHAHQAEETFSQR